MYFGAARLLAHTKTTSLTRAVLGAVLGHALQCERTGDTALLGQVSPDGSSDGFLADQQRIVS
jgi:hypothetical protein